GSGAIENGCSASPKCDAYKLGRLCTQQSPGAKGDCAGARPGRGLPLKPLLHPLARLLPPAENAERRLEPLLQRLDRALSTIDLGVELVLPSPKPRLSSTRPSFHESLLAHDFRCKAARDHHKFCISPDPPDHPPGHRL